MASSSLVVTGSIGIDTIHTPHHPVAENVMGGSCAYFAASASLLAPVRLVAAVGEDWPTEHEAVLRNFDRIDVAGLERRAGSKTFRWTGKYHDNMNVRETLDVQQGILGEAPPPVPTAFADSDFVFLANTDPASQKSLRDSFPDCKLAVADTMDLWINTMRDDLVTLLKSVHGLVLNDSEATLMTGVSNAITAAKQIRDDYGLQFVLVKKGEHGSILVHEDGLAALPAYPAEKVDDPTGAGDSFAGGLMGFLAANDRTDFEALQLGMALGTVMATFTIESFSLDRLTTLTNDELIARLNRFAQIVRVK